MLGIIVCVALVALMVVCIKIGVGKPKSKDGDKK